MREIKFRAWCEREKRILYPRAMEKTPKGGWWISSEEDNGCKLFIDSETLEPYSKNDSYCKLMQYTGLKDKNGKEIYEGDVLGRDDKQIHGIQSEFGRVEVRFGEYDDSSEGWGSAGYGWFVDGYHGYYRASSVTDIYPTGEQSLVTVNKKYEIIGNIYENPELIKKEETKLL